MSIRSVRTFHDAALEPAESTIRRESSDLAATTRIAGDGADRTVMMPTDPGFTQQWHLHRLDAGGDRGLDLRVTEVWPDYTGSGVTVALNEKVRFNAEAPDLAGRVLGDGTNNVDAAIDPFNHSTLMATMIVGNAGNGIGGVGVAHGASITAHIGESGTAAYDVVVTAISFSGVFQAPALSLDDFRAAIEHGRDGLGTVHVRAAGNSRLQGQETSHSVLTSDQSVITVAAITSQNVIGSYSNPGASVLVSAFGGPGNKPGLALRTSNAAGEMEDFGGTSGASAQVGGVVALMLEANPDLGYRDIQEILAYSARQVDITDAGWQFNGAANANGGGLHTSRDYGFGLVDAHAAVRLAETWLEQSTYANRLVQTHVGQGGLAIPDLGALDATVLVEHGMKIDRVSVSVQIEHGRYSDLRIELISPDGTVSVLTDIQAAGGPAAGPATTGLHYTFDSVQFWGETGEGEWTLRVTDQVTGESGLLLGWSLALIGDAGPNDVYVYTDEFAALAAADPSRATLADSDGIDTLNAAAMTGPVHIDLAAGHASLGGTPVTFAPGTWIENAMGGDANDVLIGNHFDNLLMGGRGDDTIFGGAGNDTIAGGAGRDTLYGGDGFDVLSYAGSNAGVTIDLASGSASGGHAAGDRFFGFEGVIGSAHADTLVGNAGNNLFEGGAGADLIYGGNGSDTASFASSRQGVTVDLAAGRGYGGDAEGDVLHSIENLIGSAFADTLVGTAGANTLYGGAGDDLLVGGGGADWFFGGEGVDTVSFAALDKGVTAHLSATPGRGNFGAAGIEGVENLIGSAFADTLVGDASDNVLEGGAGADRLVGGGGSNTASYAGSTAAVHVDLSAGSGWGGHAEGDALEGIGNLRGSAFADTLVGDGGDNILEGGGGGDTLIGGGGFDVASYASAGAGVSASLAKPANNTGDAAGDAYIGISGLIGSNWNDVLTASAAGSALWGGGGDDTLVAGGGADTLFGGDGIDAADLAALDKGIVVDLAAGTAGPIAMSGIEIVHAGAGDDTIFGSAARETLFGGDGDDTIFWSPGRDSLDGGAGVDTLSLELFAMPGHGVRVTIHDNGGSVTILSPTGGASPDATLTGFENVIGTAMNDHLTGNQRDNTIFGGDGNDALFGGAGNDTLYGGQGDDTIAGGTGDDVLFGGEGFDTLNLAATTAFYTVDLTAGTATSTAGTDTFSGFERILLGNRGNVVQASEGSDTVIGGSLDDLFLASGNANWFEGGHGFDTISYENASSGVRVHLGVDNRALGIDTLLGFERVIGSAFNDTLVGGDGGEIFVGGGGSNSIDGGGGSDTIDYSDAGQGVFVDLQSGATGGGASDALVSIENVVGSAFSDTLFGNDGDNRFWGGAGADTIDGRGGIDFVSYAGSTAAVTVDLHAGTGHGGWAEGDVLRSIESVEGSAFSDTLIGDGLDGILSGGDGDDTIFGYGAAQIHGGAGDDLIFGGGGSTVFGGAGNDVIHTDAGSSVLAGAGDDVIHFLPGPSQAATTIDGGNGHDTIHVGGSRNTLVLGSNGNLAMENVERLDLGTGNAAVLSTAYANSTKINGLQLTGNHGSSVELVGQWDDMGVVAIGNETWHVFEYDTQLVYIGTDLHVSFA